MKNKTMNPIIAKENLQILNDLVPHIKLKADSEGRLTFEDRYFPQVRRALTHDSREHLLTLLQQTFELSEETHAVKLAMLQKLRPILTETYPSYQRLQEVFDLLIVTFGGEVIEVSHAGDAGDGGDAGDADDIEEVAIEEGTNLNLTIEEPVLLFNLDSLNFKQSDVNTYSVVSNECGLNVVTNRSRNGYLLSSKPISVSGMKQLDIIFQVSINQGGFGIGLLDTNGIWVPNCYKNFLRKEFVEGVITLPVAVDAYDVMIVFYNCCSPADKSIFTINQVMCYGTY